MPMPIAAQILALLGASNAAASANQEQASFRINGVSFEMPVPAGYCLPSGEQVDVIQIMAAADDRNLTHLAFLRCDGQNDPYQDYVLVKTPRQAVSMSMTRDQLLLSMEGEFRNGPLADRRARQALIGSARESFSSTTGVAMELDGDIRPLGLDDRCAYLGGSFTVTSPDITYSLSLGGCITATEDRVFWIAWYGPRQGSAGVEDLLARSRSLAEQVRRAAR